MDYYMILELPNHCCVSKSHCVSIIEFFDMKFEVWSHGVIKSQWHYSHNVREPESITPPKLPRRLYFDNKFYSGGMIGIVGNNPLSNGGMLSGTYFYEWKSMS